MSEKRSPTLEQLMTRGDAAMFETHRVIEEMQCIVRDARRSTRSMAPAGRIIVPLIGPDQLA